MRWIAEGIWLVAAVIAYETIAPVIAVRRAVPVLPVILIVRVALTRGTIPGNLIGFAAGLTLDAFSATWFGATMLVDSVVGYTVGAVRTRVVIDSAFVRLGVLLGAAEAHSVGLLLVRSMAGPVGPEPFVIALGSGVYTAIVGAVWWGANDVGRMALGWRSIWHGER